MPPPPDTGSDRDLFTPAPLPVAALDDRGRLACLRLIRSENVGPVTFRQLINRYGGAQAALDALPDLARRSGRARPLTICSLTNAERELAAATAAGAQPLFTIEPGYPHALAQLEAPPPLLYVRGRLDTLSADMVAVIGSRQCSAAGLTMAQTLAAGLGAAGFIVASGLARGIDGAAHRAALSTGTVGVLAGGIDHVYPPENRDLFEAIPASGGAIVTEMPPGYEPRAQDFPRRNRIISGIARGVVVVEANHRSGSLITARLAGEQGREVFAVPGHPLDPRAEGTNRLIKEGATLITCVADVLDELGPITGRRALHVAEPSTPAPLPPHATQRPAANLAANAPNGGDDRARDAVLSALGPAPVGVDLLIRATSLTSAEVLVALLELDLAGAIERHPGQLVSRRV